MSGGNQFHKQGTPELKAGPAWSRSQSGRQNKPWVYREQPPQENASETVCALGKMLRIGHGDGEETRSLVHKTRGTSDDTK